MLKLIKQIYSDLTEFFLLLLTGVSIGSIFTLAYIKYDVKTSISFADIGGMLAGMAGLGLLYVAIKARNEWKKQFHVQQTTHAIDEYFRAYRNILMSIGEIATASKEIKDLEKLMTLKNDPENPSRMISLKAKRKSEILKAFPRKKDFSIARIRLEHFYKKELKHATLVDDFANKITNLDSFDFKLYTDMKKQLKELEQKLMPELYISIPHLL